MEVFIWQVSLYSPVRALSLSLRFFPFTLLFVLSSINIVFLFSRKRRRRVKRQTKYNQTNKIRIVLILLVFHSLNSFFSFHCRIARSLSHTVLFVLSVAFSCDFLRRYFYIYIFYFSSLVLGQYSFLIINLICSSLYKLKTVEVMWKMRPKGFRRMFLFYVAFGKSV